MIGGGDSAMEDSIFVSKFAADLTIVHRRDDFRASKIMLERARERDNISFKTPYVAGGVHRRRRRQARQGPAPQRGDGRVEEIEVGGAFVAIGHTPRSELVRDQVEVDDDGYVVTRDGSTRTNLAGVFAVGDLVDHTYRQAVTAAGTGMHGRARRRVVPARHPTVARGPLGGRRRSGFRRARRGAPPSPLAADPAGTRQRLHDVLGGP